MLLDGRLIAIDASSRKNLGTAYCACDNSTTSQPSDTFTTNLGLNIESSGVSRWYTRLKRAIRTEAATTPKTHSQPPHSWLSRSLPARPIAQGEVRVNAALPRDVLDLPSHQRAVPQHLPSGTRGRLLAFERELPRCAFKSVQFTCKRLLVPDQRPFLK